MKILGILGNLIGNYRGIEKKEIVTDNADRKNFITRLGLDSGGPVIPETLVTPDKQMQQRFNGVNNHSSSKGPTSEAPS